MMVVMHDCTCVYCGMYYSFVVDLKQTTSCSNEYLFFSPPTQEDKKFLDGDFY